MPWKESAPVTERVKFVCDYDTGLFSMTELCRRYGISRKTGYKWVERFRSGGPSALEDSSRAPQSCPHRTSDELVDEIVELRKTHPTWGPKKLIRILSTQYPSKNWPAVSTAGQWLKRRGLVKTRRTRQRSAHPGKPHVEVQGPNDLWTVDFKGDFLMGNGKRCYPLTLMDRYSRLILAIEGHCSTAMLPVRECFERIFREQGLPVAILSDNGAPFSSPAILGLSRLSVWWMKLGISHVLIEKGRPDQNGGHERMHRDLKAETARPPARNSDKQQLRFGIYLQDHNELRPHEALGMDVPAKHYSPSERPFPSQLYEVEYPGHFEVRRVRRHGEIKWQGARLFLTECLAGELVGLEEIDDGIVVLEAIHAPDRRSWKRQVLERFRQNAA